MTAELPALMILPRQFSEGQALAAMQTAVFDVDELSRVLSVSLYSLLTTY
jgi:hypothetical protein